MRKIFNAKTKALLAAVLAAAVFLAGAVFPAGVPAAEAKTVLQAYENLKGGQEFTALMQELVSTGKVLEADIDGFVRELSSKIPSGLSSEDFEFAFFNAGVSLIMQDKYKNLRDACLQKYGQEFEDVLKGKLPSSFVGLKDAFLKELYGSQPATGGGGGGLPAETPQVPAVPAEQVSDQPAGQPAGQSGAAFSDLAGHWAREVIEYMAAQGYVSGVGGGLFAPDRPVTRAQFASLLVRILGVAGSGSQLSPVPFKDISDAAWYAGAVRDAYVSGLISGYPGGLFKPDALISRQELAVLAWAALNYRYDAASRIDANLSGVSPLASFDSVFADSSSVAPWAREAVAYLAAAGIMKGRSGGVFAPLGTATRAEAVALLKQVLDFRKQP